MASSQKDGKTTIKALILIFLFFYSSFSNEEIKNSVESANNPNDSSSFRSPQSDVEIPKTRKRVGNDSTDSLANKLDPLVVTKENMSTSRRPAGKELKGYFKCFTLACLTQHVLICRLGFHSTKTVRLAANFDSLQCFACFIHSWINFCTTWNCVP